MDNAQKKIEDFFSMYPTHTYPKGKIFLQPDDSVNSLFYIVSGNVVMYSISQNGEKTTVNIFRPGSYFPLMIVLADCKNEYYFESITKTTCYIAPKKNVLEFITKDTEVLFDITTRFAKGIMGLTKRITEASSSSLPSRIQSLMEYMENRFPQNKNETGTIQLRHEDIANWLGVSRETISRALSKKKSTN